MSFIYANVVQGLRVQRFTTEVAALTDERLRAVAELHRPHLVGTDFDDMLWLECHGCDTTEAQITMVDWPCKTIAVLFPAIPRIR